MWIVLLAVVATSFAFMVSIQVLKQLTPFESAMAINLEPIYAIALAYVLFGERFSPVFTSARSSLLGPCFWTPRCGLRPEKTTQQPVPSDPLLFGDAVSAIGCGHETA